MYTPCVIALGIKSVLIYLVPMVISPVPASYFSVVLHLFILACGDRDHSQQQLINLKIWLKHLLLGLCYPLFLAKVIISVVTTMDSLIPLKHLSYTCQCDFRFYLTNTAFSAILPVMLKQSHRQLPDVKAVASIMSWQGLLSQPQMRFWQ